MSSGMDRQIFEDAGRPEEAPDLGGGGPDLDHAVDEAIRGLGRGGSDDLPSPRPQARQPDKPAPSAPPGLDGVDDRSNSGLLRALLDERDRRQELKGQLDRYEKEKRDREAREQKPALSERLFTDPDGTIEELKREITAPLQQTIAQMQVNQDFAYAEARHGDTFRAAWAEWYEQVKDGKDATTYFTVMNSQSPGEAMVNWYRRASRDKEVGEDLDAYKQKVIDEYLSGNRLDTSPARGPNGQFQPRPQAPRTPTSISRMGSSGNPSDDEDVNDGTDAAIFAAARPTHRRQR